MQQICPSNEVSLSGFYTTLPDLPVLLSHDCVHNYVMDKRNYNIVMETPLGKKKGNIMLFINDGADEASHAGVDIITGEISILDVSEPFIGTLGEDGFCKFNGNLKTPGKEIAYEAIGKLSDYGIDLLLNTDSGLFHIKSIKDVPNDN